MNCATSCQQFAREGPANQPRRFTLNPAALRAQSAHPGIVTIADTLRQAADLQHQHARRLQEHRLPIDPATQADLSTAWVSIAGTLATVATVAHTSSAVCAATAPPSPPPTSPPGARATALALGLAGRREL
ncbi:MAG: hypothetical protein M3Y71_09945 [Actinomycetota bacterium]|nr:hypothetical protein [Actinomycetota bacterium]